MDDASIQPDDEHDDDLAAEANDGDSLLDALTLRQQKAIIALLNEPTIPKAAQAAGVAQRSLYRWLDNEAFGKAYRKARRDAFSQAIALTQHYAPLAVNTLAKVMADSQAPHHARVTAAATLLKFGREGIELDDLAARVESLERAQAIQDNASCRSQAA